MTDKQEKFWVVDAHCDTLIMLHSKVRDLYQSQGPVNLSNLKAGNVRLQFFAAYISEAFKPYGSLCRCIQLLRAYWQMIQHYSPHFIPVLTKDDARRIADCGSSHAIGALLSIEGGEALEGSTEVLELLFSAGVRAITLTWNQRNQLADGSWEEEAGGGLTKIGKRTVKAMNSLGITVDVSHMTPKGALEAIEVSSSPIIASHSNCRNLCQHKRNLPDELIKALANQGGVMGITFYPPFLHDDTKKANVETLADHLEHAAAVAGTHEHLGIGSDFDGIETSLPGLVTSRDYSLIWQTLDRRGWTKKQIQDVAGNNFIRILEQNLPAKKICHLSELELL